MRHGDHWTKDLKFSLGEDEDYITGSCPGVESIHLGCGCKHGDRAEDTFVMLERLGKTMYKRGKTSSDALDNPWIPAGYTYLGQLLSHDVSFDPSPLPIPSLPKSPTSNLRTSALDLDCIYRGGPMQSPWLYQLEGGKGERIPRKRLRVGFVRWLDGKDKEDAGQSGSESIFDESRAEDLARVHVGSPNGNLSDVRKRNSKTDLGYYETVIGDLRNEDTLILSQLTLLFHKIHNCIVDKLINVLGLDERDEGVFETARVLNLKCYRAVILNDLLFRLLDQKVWDNIRSGAVPFRLFCDRLRDKHGVKIPLEFSVAAMRVGHAMVRPCYDFNSKFLGADLRRLLDFNSNTHSTVPKVPITSDWPIDWSRFFPAHGEDGAPLTDKPFNKSRLLLPSITEPLYANERLEPENHERTTPPVNREHQNDPGHRGALIYRDLVRGYTSGLPCGQSLARTAGILKTEKSIDRFNKKIRSYLDKHFKSINENVGLDFISLISESTPLFFYILFEAEVEHGGKRLGKLGSTIVAEVIHGLVQAFPLRESEAVKSAEKHLFGDEGVPSSMPRLIGTLKEWTEKPDVEKTTE